MFCFRPWTFRFESMGLPVTCLGVHAGASLFLARPGHAAEAAVARVRCVVGASAVGQVFDELLFLNSAATMSLGDARFCGHGVTSQPEFIGYLSIHAYRVAACFAIRVSNMRVPAGLVKWLWWHRIPPHFPSSAAWAGEGRGGFRRHRIGCGYPVAGKEFRCPVP